MAGLWTRLHADLLRLLRRDGELEHHTAWNITPLGTSHGLEDHTSVIDGVRVTGANASDHHQPGQGPAAAARSL